MHETVTITQVNKIEGVAPLQAITSGEGPKQDQLTLLVLQYCKALSSILPLNVCPLDVGTVPQFEPYLWKVYDINSKTIQYVRKIEFRIKDP